MVIIFSIPVLIIPRVIPVKGESRGLSECHGFPLARE